MSRYIVLGLKKKITKDRTAAKIGTKVIRAINIAVYILYHKHEFFIGYEWRKKRTHVDFLIASNSPLLKSVIFPA